MKRGLPQWLDENSQIPSIIENRYPHQLQENHRINNGVSLDSLSVSSSYRPSVNSVRPVPTSVLSSSASSTTTSSSLSCTTAATGRVSSRGPPPPPPHQHQQRYRRARAAAHMRATTRYEGPDASDRHLQALMRQSRVLESLFDSLAKSGVVPSGIVTGAGLNGHSRTARPRSGSTGEAGRLMRPLLQRQQQPGPPVERRLRNTNNSNNSSSNDNSNAPVGHNSNRQHNSNATPPSLALSSSTSSSSSVTTSTSNGTTTNNHIKANKAPSLVRIGMRKKNENFLFKNHFLCTLLYCSHDCSHF